MQKFNIDAYLISSQQHSLYWLTDERICSLSINLSYIMQNKKLNSCTPIVLKTCSYTLYVHLKRDMQCESNKLRWKYFSSVI